VIAHGKGGVHEPIRGLAAPAPTGLVLPDQTAAGLARALELFEGNAQRFTAAACRDNAARFAPERFRAAIGVAVGTALREHASATGVPARSAP
jgi:hypothetical protein